MRTLLGLLLITLTAAVAGACLADDAPAIVSDRFVIASSASKRERLFAKLVSDRAEAIDFALGRILNGACADIYIEFARSSDPSYPRMDAAAYDPVRHTLTFRRGLLESLDFDVTYWAKAYWPYYQREDLQAVAPAIGIVDEALWMAHLQEAAHRNGVSWPHAECSSMDLATRLGCEMLVAGARGARQPPTMFNTNRMDLLWPDSLRELRSRGWRQGDGVYRDVQRLGGLLLVRALIAEFGVPRVLQHIAQHPFHIADENVRVSALLYQQQARQTLAADAIN